MVRLGCGVLGDPTELKCPSYHILSKVYALNMTCPRGEVEPVDPITLGRVDWQALWTGVSQGAPAWCRRDGGTQKHYKRAWPVGLGGAQWLREAGRVTGCISELILCGGSLREGFIGKIPERVLKDE